MGKTRRDRNSPKGRITFNHQGGNYKATGITAIVQHDETSVEVRYGDGSNPLILDHTSVGSVIAAVDRAKGVRR